jgi:hypothetical protein
MGWLTDLKNGAGNAAAYGLAPATFGASLAGKKKIRRTAGNAWDSISGADAAEDAARMQEEGATQAAGTLRDFYGKAEGYHQPYLEGGRVDYGRLRDLVAGGAYDVPDEPFNLEADAGYAFRQAEGEKAIMRRAAANGRSLGGGTLKDLMRFNQGLASEEADRAYGRFDRNRAFRSGEMGARYGRLAHLADYGPQTAGTLGNQAAVLGGSLADLQLDQANARAAGRTGAYNARRDLLMGLGGLAASAYGRTR